MVSKRDFFPKQMTYTLYYITLNDTFINQWETKWIRICTTCVQLLVNETQKRLKNSHHVHEPVLPLLSRAIVCLPLSVGHNQRDVNQFPNQTFQNVRFKLQMLCLSMDLWRRNALTHLSPLIQFTLVVPTVYLVREENAHFNSIRLLKGFKAVVFHKLFE